MAETLKRITVASHSILELIVPLHSHSDSVWHGSQLRGVYISCCDSLQKSSRLGTAPSRSRRRARMPAMLSRAAGPDDVQRLMTAANSLGFSPQKAGTAAPSSHMQPVGALSVCQPQRCKRSTAETNAGRSRHQPPRWHTGRQERSATDRHQATLQLLMRLLGRPTPSRGVDGAPKAAKRSLRQMSSGQRRMRRRVRHRHWLSNATAVG